MDSSRPYQDATALLEAVVEDRGLLDALDPALRQRLLIAAGRVSKPDKSARRALAQVRQRRNKVERRDVDRALLGRTRIRTLRANPIFETPRRVGAASPMITATDGEAAVDGAATGAGPEAGPSGTTPPIGRVSDERVCYICRARTTAVHWFYDQMCLACGDINHAKREQTADLRGRTALITGSRVKIGFQAAIMLLRAGAHVISLTRFPVDAAARYAREPDFADWSDRLEIHGLDLRHTPSVEALCTRILDTHDRLDFIINNACQTVRRPPAFYNHMMAGELSATLDDQTRALVAFAASPQALPAAALSQVKLLDEDHLDPTALFPADRLDADLQQVDLRKENSWRLQMDRVSTIELLEVHLVNAVAPFVLNARLKPLMTRVPTSDKHIVNVSAVDGQFYRTFKSDRHPHTNMAKASLNMMTRTSAADYVQHGIHMNSVDTGWVTDEDPAEHAEMKREMHDFNPPLDIVDGAARILDPIFHGLNSGEHVWGQFLKDYQVTDW